MATLWDFPGRRVVALGQDEKIPQMAVELVEGTGQQKFLASALHQQRMDHSWWGMVVEPFLWLFVALT